MLVGAGFRRSRGGDCIERDEVEEEVSDGESRGGVGSDGCSGEEVRPPSDGLGAADEV